MKKIPILIASFRNKSQQPMFRTSMGKNMMWSMSTNRPSLSTIKTTKRFDKYKMRSPKLKNKTQSVEEQLDKKSQIKKKLKRMAQFNRYQIS